MSLIFVDLFGDWPQDDLLEAARAGAILRINQPLTDAPVLRDTLDGGAVPAGLRPGDHLLCGESTRLAALISECQAMRVRLWVRCTSVAQVKRAPPGCGLWLQGSEHPDGAACSGLILARAAQSRPFVLTGIGARARLASVALGATGVLIDVAAWLLPGSPIVDSQRRRLGRVRSGRQSVIQPNGQRQLQGGPQRLLQRWWLHEGSAIPAPENLSDLLRYVGSSTLASLVQRVAVELKDASQLKASAQAAPIALVQGPMANISEDLAFANIVSEAGALPVVALGGLRPERSESLLKAHARAGRPWGVGLIGFDVLPHREAHVQQLIAARPSVVIIAGGSQQLARRVQDEGLTVWLHTPSPGLCALALQRGVKGVIFEGREAGGHVGALSSLGLWEEGLAVVEQATEPVDLVLAGGIGDRFSVLFARLMAHRCVALGHSLYHQVGTAFLFTHELLESGQLQPDYLQAGVAATSTQLVGQSVGLPMRCVPSTRSESALRREQEWLEQGLSLTERRGLMERLNLGASRIAAKGITRHKEGYRSVTSGAQRSEGLYSFGEDALLRSHPLSVRRLVRALKGESPPRWTAPLQVKTPPPPDVPVKPQVNEPIAIIGLGCVLPGASDVAAFWKNTLLGLDQVKEIPPERWDPAVYFNPSATQRGSSYSASRMAGAVENSAFRPSDFGIPPSALPTLDRSQQLALMAARQAVASAGLSTEEGHRAGVVIGNAMGGQHAKDLALRVRFRQVLAALNGSSAMDDLTPAQRESLSDEVESALSQTLPPLNVDTMSGALSNVIAGRVASWLDWNGPNITVDAACAASLAAVSVAVDWLRMGRCDMVLTGGVDTDLSPETYVGFSRTHALSSAHSRPFSSDADGFVMGEGAALFVLKRLSDAERANDPIWAVIRGVGLSSDGRAKGITAPSVHGQQLAIDRAWTQAGHHPREADFFEAHGTGTGLGDRVEVQALRERVAASKRPIWLGSVKSSLGHLKGAAGAAGLLKAVLSQRTGHVPPTLNAGPVNPALGLNDGPLRLPRYATRVCGEGSGLAGVSAFGFGGTNVHIVLQEALPSHRLPALLSQLHVPPLRPVNEAAWPLNMAQLHHYSASSIAALIEQVQQNAPGEEGPYRLAYVSKGSDQRHERALRWLSGDRSTSPPPWCFFGQDSSPPVVLLVPGQGSQRPGSVDSLARFPVARRALQAVEARIARPLRDLEGSSKTRDLHPLLFGLAAGWVDLLRAAEVPIAGAIGHSLGELGALYAARAFSLDQGLNWVLARAEALSSCPPGQMVASQASAEVPPGFSLAAENAAEFTVFSGDITLPVPAHCFALKVEHAFHSPSMAPAQDALSRALSSAPLQPLSCAVWSGISGQTLDRHSAKQALVDALVQPVRFVQAVQRAAQEGPKLFVELGPGGALSRWARATSPQSQVISLDAQGTTESLLLGMAALFAAGHTGLIAQLGADRPSSLAPAFIPSERPVARPSNHQSRAMAVQDLRIASLADPKRRPDYLRARGALLHALAEDDQRALGLMATAPSPARLPTPSTFQPAPTSQQPVVRSLTPKTQRAPVPPAKPEASRPKTDDIAQTVLAVISEVSGYSSDELRLDARLDVDLGIDSIRKLEILGQLQDTFELPDTESDLSQSDGLTVGQLITHVRALSGATKPVTPAAALAQPVLARPLWRPHSTERRTLNEGFYVDEQGTLWWSSAEQVEAKALLLTWLAWTRSAPRPSALRVALRRSDPAHHALAGFCRSLAQEWSLSLSLCWTDLGQIAALSAGEYREKAGVMSRLEWTRHLVSSGASRWDGAFVMATGGGTGIVARCLKSLSGAKVVLIGRTSERGEGERSALLRRSLADLRSAGLDLHYLAVDLLNASALSAALQPFVTRWGQPKLLIHGAGLLRDAPVHTLNADDLNRVWDPKVEGLQGLQGLHPKNTVHFGSVVARLGNPGQTLYGAANAYMEQMGPPGSTLTIGWSAWSEVGMASSVGIQSALKHRGVPIIQPSVGQALFEECLGETGSIYIIAPSLLAGLPWPLYAVNTSERSAQLRLSCEEDALADHVVGGRPLVPAALWVEALFRTLWLLSPERAVELHQLEVLHPTFVSRERDDLWVRPLSGDKLGVFAGQTLVARAAFQDITSAKEPPSPSLEEGLDASDLYRSDLLFHGSSWQVIDRIWQDSVGPNARVTLTHGVSPLASLIDAAYQLFSAWTGTQTGQLGLPIRTERWSLSPQPLPSSLHVVLRPSPQSLRADVFFYTLEGVLVGWGQGLELKAAAAWPSDGPSHFTKVITS